MDIRNETLDRNCDVIMSILESNHLQHASRDAEISSKQLRDEAIEKSGMSKSAFYKALSYLVDEKQHVKKQVHSDAYRTVTYSINEVE